MTYNFPNRPAVERALQAAQVKPGTHTNDGREYIRLPAGTLQHMLAIIDKLAEGQGGGNGAA